MCKALQLYGMCHDKIAVHTLLGLLTKVGGAANALNLLLGIPKVVLELTAVQAEAVPDPYRLPLHQVLQLICTTDEVFARRYCDFEVFHGQQAFRPECTRRNEDRLTQGRLITVAVLKHSMCATC